MNAYDELEKALVTGELNHNSVQIAYRAWLRKRKDIPDEIKNILSGEKHQSGLIGEIFQVISHTVGGVELAFRRGYQAGCEDTIEKQKKNK